jgi:hypothetical protein
VNADTSAPADGVDEKDLDRIIIIITMDDNDRDANFSGFCL